MGIFKKRINVVRQAEAAECGLACLAMVASANGHHLDMREARRRFPLTLKGATLERLMNFASELGMEARALRLEPDQLRFLRFPAILHWDLKHFVVVEAATGKALTIVDPARGRLQLKLEDVSNHFTGVALELVPGMEFRPKPKTPAVSIRSLLGPVKGGGGALAWILLLSVMLQALTLLVPLQLQWTVDQALDGGDSDMLVVIGIGFLMLVVIHAATSAVRSWSILYLSTLLSAQWTTSTFAHLLRLPTAYFIRRHLGDVVSRFGSIHAIERTLSSTFVEGVIDGLVVVVTVVLMLMYSVPLTLVCLGAVALYLLLRTVYFKPYRDNNEDRLEKEARQSSHFLESVRGIQSVKVGGIERSRRQSWQNHMIDTMNANLHGARLTLAFGTASQVLFGIERVLVVWVGALLVQSSTLSLGMLLAFIAYKEQFGMRVKNLVDKLIELRMLSLHAERLGDVVLHEPEPLGQEQTDARLDGSLEVRDLWFSYDQAEQPVLRGVNLSVRPGECLAIAGRSGDGKSTFAKVILGLLDPDKGSVSWGGVDHRSVGWSALRRQLGVVMQDDVLFAGTITENIRSFAPDVTQEDIFEAARTAGILDDIQAMPMGFSSLIGDMGSTFSGGQKQRIILARALVKKPRVLILDEATSHLDIDSEAFVSDSIRRLNITRIIIAHRPETLRSADRVIQLEAGVFVPRPVCRLAERATA